ncbi:MAG: serine acetyltransferase [Clostridiales Family XIII bacterium]|jgi:serine O-acetyltransferase|nr:serine acetyltransferase [Clostridiales Family XIII bacterium]
MAGEHEEGIHKLVSLMMDSYHKEPDIIKIETSKQINKAIVLDIVEDLRSLVFAGFFGGKRLREDGIEYFVGELLEKLIYNMERQIRRALRTESGGERDESEVAEEAACTTHKFLKTIPKVRRLLSTDVDASFDGDPAASSKDEIILSYPGIYAIMVSRLAHELYLLDVPLIPRMMTEHAHSLTGIDIHPGATIGHHFFLDHGTGIVVGETTIIGNYVKIYQGVTLGALSTKGGRLLSNVKRHPTIEDNVTIYSGASIFGGDTVIGEGVVIGSNAFITKSVAEKTRVSVKDPELQFRSDEEKLDEKGQNNEFTQDELWYYVI